MWFTTAVLLTILSYTWILQPRVPPAVPIAVVLTFGFWHSLRSGEWGFARRALRPGLRAAALFTLPIVVAIAGVGAVRGTLHDRVDDLATIAVLVVWGGGQQWILQTVVLREAQRRTSQRWGVLVAAVLFAVVHLPNPFLTAMTFVGALGWCALYARHPNIIPLALSHALATLAILYAFDVGLTGGLRIGQAFLR
jgi:membrane protease YdiL (CAAX protease family)